MAWQWDPAHNCVLQVESNLIGRALNDFPLYKLMTNYQPPTTVMMAQPAKQCTEEPACADHQMTMTAHQANDLDSLSNSTLSQGTWFTTMTTQLDALTTQQNKLETQTSNQLSTILAQLETIQTSTWRNNKIGKTLTTNMMDMTATSLSP